VIIVVTNRRLNPDASDEQLYHFSLIVRDLIAIKNGSQGFWSIISLRGFEKWYYLWM
jgi:hypothetical protein